jgi:hypothetical protein
MQVQLIFWGAALFGSVFFLLRVITMIVGGLGTETHDDMSDADASDTGDSHQTSDAAFKLLSLNSLTGFIALFGWAGLAAYVQYSLPFSLALLIAGACGLVAMLATSLLFYGALKLKSDGARFAIEQATGATAAVYLRIPANGTGRISCVVEGARHEIDAVSDTGEEIASFETVLVTRTLDSRTVAVIPFKEGV